MFLKLFSGEQTNYQGLSLAQTILVGFILFAVTVLLLAATFLFQGMAARALIFSLVLLWTVLFIWWLRNHVREYAEKITKSKLIAKRFQNISKYFESILQDSTDIIFTLDTEGYILKFNRGAQIHFGYTQEEIVGKPLTQLFQNESDHRKVLANVLRDGKTVNEEIPLKANSGSIILVNLSMSEMKNDSNQIIGLVGTAKDITEKKQLEMELLRKNEQLEQLVISDPLTGLYNSRHFYEQIRRELSRLRRNPGRKLTIVMLDIDYFKQLNDTEGHQMGDHTLKSLANVIRVCIRKDIDTAYRYGGDEFILLLPDTDKHQARVVTDRIQKQYGAFKFGSTSLSMGIAEAMTGEDDTSLIRRSDEALYASKRDGRARITVAV
ncbi:MAG: GGDEF domain-containing protein [Chitinispirillaceae bacterium]|nr:GGDEF domain-containing protein [Chitinispirillaceae bacterium]